MIYRSRLLACLMLMFSPFSQAETADQATLPSLELLEFIGEWEGDDGQWIDPQSLQDSDFMKLLQLTEEEGSDGEKVDHE